MTEALTEACTQGIALLDDLLGTVAEEHSRFEGKTISPAFLVRYYDCPWCLWVKTSCRP